MYDRHVCMNLDLQIPGAHKSAVDRLKGYVEMYATLEAATEDLIKAPAFTRTLRPAFDNRFAEYTYIADVKKLDFLIWQFRTASKNAYPKAVRIRFSSWCRRSVKSPAGGGHKVDEAAAL